MSEIIATGAGASARGIATAPLRISIGIEGTFEPFSGRDTLVTSRHFERGNWQRDFNLVRRLGVKEFRYPVPWHRVERTDRRYDWRELDRALGSALEDEGLTIIADPLHHTSYPAWLRGG